MKRTIGLLVKHVSDGTIDNARIYPKKILKKFRKMAKIGSAHKNVKKIIIIYKSDKN